MTDTAIWEILKEIDIKFGLGENSRLSLDTKGYYLGHLILDITYQKILLWQTVPAEDNLVDVVCKVDPMSRPIFSFF